jgi:hypothetical protein
VIDILVKSIPHSEHRYPTCGDYWYEGGGYQVRVSDMGNMYYEFLVAMHEQIEYMICLRAGIREEDITAFDIMFEEERDRGLHGPDDEPGDDPRAPYYWQHQTATIVERIVCQTLGLRWEDYCAAIEALWEEKEPGK